MKMSNKQCLARLIVSRYLYVLLAFFSKALGINANPIAVISRLLFHFRSVNRLVKRFVSLYAGSLAGLLRFNYQGSVLTVLHLGR